MIYAQVVGTATGTIKHKSFEGARMLVCETINPGGARANAFFVATDWTGAGKGDHVLVTTDGEAAAQKHHDEHSPMRNTIIGIIDELEEAAV